MRPTRRQVIAGAAGAGGLLLARPLEALAGPLGPAPFSTSRVSKLFPTSRLVHADLHNHTILSDGDGDAAAAFGSMRASGLDVAALTDHATVGQGMPTSPCQGQADCQGVYGIDETSWAQLKALADAADDDDAFVAIRGFEWSSPTMGHMNVWFSERWTDPLHTGGVTTGATITDFLHGTPLGENVDVNAVHELIAQYAVTGGVMTGFYQWLRLAADTPGVGGGLDGIAGWNHPGREVDRFNSFAFNSALVDQVVSLELFNRNEDYFFEGTDAGRQSPLNECLNAGWKPGLLGVTDEHGTNWGYPEGKGRAGLWVDSFDRAGVKAAMQRRSFFATRLRGLRLDAAANGFRMGSTHAHASGPMTFTLDVDRGAEWVGKQLVVQVLQSGDVFPEIKYDVPVTVPAADAPAITFTRDIDIADGSWVVLRVVDPAPDPSDKTSVDGRAAGTPYASYGPAIAYASPFYLSADATPVVPEAPPYLLPLAAAGLAAGAFWAAAKSLQPAPVHAHPHADDHSHPHPH